MTDDILSSPASVVASKSSFIVGEGCLINIKVLSSLIMLNIILYSGWFFDEIG